MATAACSVRSAWVAGLRARGGVGRVYHPGAGLSAPPPRGNPSRLPHPSHPLRYSFRRNRSAPSSFALSAFASQVIGLPSRYDTTPSSTASVSAPAYSKLHVVAPPFLHACTHSLWWPADF